MTRGGVGIDPGQRGGIARATDDGVRAMPADRWHGRILTPEAARIALQSVGAQPGDLCYIERVMPRPGQSQASGMTIQANYATWCRAATDYGLVLSRKSTARLDALAGLPRGGARKLRVIAWCQEAYPALDLTPGQRTKPHDGMADAVLFAHAALRMVRRLNQ